MAGQQFRDEENNLWEQDPSGQLTYVGKYTPPEPSLTKDVGRAVGRGLIKGINSFGDLGVAVLKATQRPIPGPAMIPQILAQRMFPDYVKSQQDYMDRVPFPSDLATEASGIEHPVRPGMQYVESGVAGATGGAAARGSKFMNVLTGATGGVGGEAAGSLVHDDPVTRVLGSLLGSIFGYGSAHLAKLGASFVGGPSVQTPKMVAAAAKGLDEPDWERAAHLQQEAADRGVQITPIQAMERETPLTGLQEQVTRSDTGGAKMTKYLSQQTADAANAGRGILGGVPSVEPPEAAGAAKAASRGAINTAKEMRTQAVLPDYSILPEPFSNDSINPVKRQMEQLLMSDQIGPTTAAGRYLRGVLGRLGDDWQGNTHGEQISTILRESKKKLQNADFTRQAGIDARSMSQIKSGLSPLENFMDSISLNRQRGEARFGAISEDMTKPLQRSIVGQIAGPKEELSANVTKRVLPILENDTTTRAQSILNAQQWMSHERPGAFSQLVKSVFENRLNKAFGGEGSFPVAEAPAKFAQAVWGSTEQTAKRENFRAMIVGAARDAGLPEGQTLRGAENLMRVMEAAGRAKGAMATAGSPSSGSPVENILTRLGPGGANQVQLRLLTRIDEMLHGKAYNELANTLTSPAGLKQLYEWSKFDISKIRLGGVSSAGIAAGQQLVEGKKRQER